VLLEAVIALSIMTVGMLGIFTVLSNSIGASRVSTNQEIAINLAAEGIEVVKSILDKNALLGVAWNLGMTGCGNGCSVQFNSLVLGSSQTNPLKFDPSTGFYGYSNGTNTVFKRQMAIIGIPPGSPSELKVTSTVSWLDRGGIPFSIVLEDRFFDWR